MAFSVDTKNELAREWTERPCCNVAELMAFVQLDGIWNQTAGGHGVAVSLTSPAAARKVFTLFKRLGVAHPRLAVSRRRGSGHRAYKVAAAPLRAAACRHLLEVQGVVAVPWRRCCRRAYIRGAFLSRGSITQPIKTYHLELTADTRWAAETVVECLHALDLPARVARRKHQYVVYLKDGEHLVSFLNQAGAHRALLQLENIRLIKAMRGDANRLVNFETANVDKTVRAAVAQTEMIRQLVATVGFERLPQHLADVARARLEHPYASLSELGKLLTLTKSGVSYRLERLGRLAQAHLPPNSPPDRQD